MSLPTLRSFASFAGICLLAHALAACEESPLPPLPVSNADGRSRDEGASDGSVTGRSPTKTKANTKKDGTAPHEDEDDSVLNGEDDGKAPTDKKGDDAKTPTSKGSGGGTGYAERTYRAANGLSSSYKIDVPADAGPDKAYGLHIHFHGDGGGGYKDFPNRKTTKDLIGVTVKAPNPNLQWGRQEGRTHGEYVQDLIQNELLKKWNIRTDRIYFSGVSGGSYFLAGNFIPTYGKDYRSGAFLMCGGEAPRVAFQDASFLKEFKIIWQVTAGERSDITYSVRQSISAYRKALEGVAAGNDAALAMQESEFLGPGGHCEFDGQSYTTGIQYMMDKKFTAVVGR